MSRAGTTACRQPLGVMLLLAALTGCAALTPVQHPAVDLQQVHPFGATRLAFSPDGTRLASGGHQGELRVWSVPGGPAVGSLAAHRAPVRGIAWLDDTTLISGALDGRLIAWETESDQAVDLLKTGPPITALAVASTAHSSRLLITGHKNGQVAVYSQAKLQAKPLAEQSFDAEILSVAVHPDETTMAISLEDQRVFLVERSLRVPRQLPGAGRKAFELRFSPDGRHLVGSAWFKLMLWDLETGQLELRDTEHKGAVTSVDFSPDGERLASIGRHTDAQVRLTRFPSGEVERRLAPHNLCGYAVRFSPDGRYLATAAEDESIRLYDLLEPYRPTIHPSP